MKQFKKYWSVAEIIVGIISLYGLYMLNSMMNVSWLSFIAIGLSGVMVIIDGIMSFKE